MTPRAQMEIVDIATTVDDLTERIERSPRSRYPVVDGDLDHIVGMVHVKDVIRAAGASTSPRLHELVRPLPTVAATASAERLLERFRREQTHAILVVDEFGGTLGLVTMDDLIAEVMDDQVGDRADEVVHHDDGSVSVDGGVTLAELRDDHGVELTHPEVTTVAGLVLADLGTIPDVGAVVDTGAGYAIEVEAVSGRRIERLRLRPTDS